MPRRPAHARAQSDFQCTPPPVRPTDVTSRLTQIAIEGALLREWEALRKRGALEPSLPSMHTKQWIGRDGQHGYVTRDYGVHPAPAALAALAPAGYVRPTLVEKYWSIRTLDGTQDPSWQPALNVHVVSIRVGEIRATDLAHASWFAAAVRSAAWIGREAGFSQPPRDAADQSRQAPVQLHVKALLIGARSSGEVQQIGRDTWAQTTPLLLAHHTYTVADGFRFTMLDDDSWVTTAAMHRPQLQDIGDALFGRDELPHTQWRWDGVNDGPVYDATTRLTVHKGRVL